jgi:hypothetical protein
MIKETDLRIGNWVIYKPYGNRDGEPKRIAGLLGMKAWFDKHTNESAMFHYLEGIPLTPEMLEKCGFVNNPDGIWREPFKLVRDKIFEGYILDDIFIHSQTNTRLIHLHRLQNLYYALTGNELQVNL